MSVDVSFLAITGLPVEAPLRVTGICGGASALLQKVILLTFSEFNEIYRPQAGGAMSLIGSASSADPSAVDTLKSTFLIALKTVEEALKSEQEDNEDLTDSERLDTISLSQFTVQADTVDATVDISTVAGDSLQVILPVSIAEG